jgi:hypothetical protein
MRSGVQVSPALQKKRRRDWLPSAFFNVPCTYSGSLCPAASHIPCSFEHRRIPLVNSKRRQILSCYRSSCQHRTFMQNHSGAYERPGAYPRAIVHPNRAHDQVKCRPRVIMVAGEQHSALRETYVATERYRRQIVNPDALPYPDMIADGQFPGKLDRHAGFEQHTSPYLRAKAPQQHDFSAVPNGQARLKKQRADQQPQRLFPTRRTTVEGGIVVSRKVNR